MKTLLPIKQMCKVLLALSLSFAHGLKCSDAPVKSYAANSTFQQLGQQLVIELYGCNQETLDNSEKIENILTEAVQAAGATIVNRAFHKFSPQGVSGVLVLSESHMAIHTWPEFGYCALDLYTCGSHCNNHAALEVLKEKFEATSSRVLDLKRGIVK